MKLNSNGRLRLRTLAAGFFLLLLQSLGQAAEIRCLRYYDVYTRLFDRPDEELSRLLKVTVDTEPLKSTCRIALLQGRLTSADVRKAKDFIDDHRPHLATVLLDVQGRDPRAAIAIGYAIRSAKLHVEIPGVPGLGQEQIASVTGSRSEEEFINTIYHHDDIQRAIYDTAAKGNYSVTRVFDATIFSTPTTALIRRAKQVPAEVYHGGASCEGSCALVYASGVRRDAGVLRLTALDLSPASIAERIALSLRVSASRYDALVTYLRDMGTAEALSGAVLSASVGTPTYLVTRPSESADFVAYRKSFCSHINLPDGQLYTEALFESEQSMRANGGHLFFERMLPFNRMARCKLQAFEKFRQS